MLQDRIAKYRTDFRRQEIDAYMKQRRREVIKNNHKESHIQAVNERVCHLLSQGNINELYGAFAPQGSERES